MEDTARRHPVQQPEDNRLYSYRRVNLISCRLSPHFRENSILYAGLSGRISCVVCGKCVRLAPVCVCLT